MYQCNYCKRFLKEKYNNCPGCGSNSFSKVVSFTEKVIKTPPVGGYKVNLKNYTYEKRNSIIPKGIGIFMISFVFIFIFFFLSDVIDAGWFAIPFVLFSIIALISVFKESSIFFKLANKNDKNVNNNVDRMKYLSLNGILIKNLPYQLEKCKEYNYGKPIYRIKVLYEIEKGRTLSLKSEPKYLTSLGRENGLVDLLIDPNDYSNYYIDFEIY